MMMCPSNDSQRTEREIGDALASARVSCTASHFMIGGVGGSRLPTLALGARLAMSEIRVTLYSMLNTGAIPLRLRRTIHAALIETESRVTYTAIKQIAAETSLDDRVDQGDPQ